ncbi:MAG TPA: hypothetical protein VIQ31_05720, partial [Phormidium sp.]
MMELRAIATFVLPIGSKKEYPALGSKYGCKVSQSDTIKYLSLLLLILFLLDSMKGSFRLMPSLTAITGRQKRFYSGFLAGVLTTGLVSQNLGIQPTQAQTLIPCQLSAEMI